MTFGMTLPGRDNAASGKLVGLTDVLPFLHRLQQRRLFTVSDGTAPIRQIEYRHGAPRVTALKQHGVACHLASTLVVGDHLAAQKEAKHLLRATEWLGEVAWDIGLRVPLCGLID